MTNTKIIRFENLKKGFQEGDRIRHVLNGVSIGFEEGQFTALLGPSGSGKSTLLNLACGIEEPDSGDVYIKDVPITRLTDHERTLFRRDNIGFVFQSFHWWDFEKTVIIDHIPPSSQSDHPRYSRIMRTHTARSFSRSS